MNRIRDLREDRDLRQIDVAQAVGIDQQTLSNYETGKTNPDSYAIIKLADFFQVSTDYLLGRTDTPPGIEAAIARIEVELDKIRSEIKKL
ncbi:MAG: helix-turn-helix transcriptional regulator [Clostridia bacterium]|nr:helix-turn-helix transcriptional regulator [Clostridia bacterium]